MKKFLFGLILCLGVSEQAFAQGHGFPYPNDPAGTTINKLAKLTNNSGVISVALAGPSDEVVGIITDGAGTTGTASLATWGRILCNFDNTSVTGDYVQNVSGSCHDAGSTRPTSGQIVGRVSDIGGSAGNYKVLLGVGQFPSAATVPLCSITGASDTLSAAGTFATVCPIPAAAISGAGQIFEVIVHGTYLSGTGTPLFNMQVNGGGTSPVCSYSSNYTSAGNTTFEWDLDCKIRIVTTGAPGTATAWGLNAISSTSTGSGIINRLFNPIGGTVSFTTNATENISIQETATPGTSGTYTLTDLVVRTY